MMYFQKTSELEHKLECYIEKLGGQIRYNPAKETEHDVNCYCAISDEHKGRFTNFLKNPNNGVVFVRLSKLDFNNLLITKGEF